MKGPETINCKIEEGNAKIPQTMPQEEGVNLWQSSSEAKLGVSVL
jgi:hypothetical protein